MDKKKVYIIGSGDNVPKDILKRIEDNNHTPVFIVDTEFTGSSEPTETLADKLSTIVPQPPKPKGKSKYHK